jgi:hypothetical protein
VGRHHRRPVGISLNTAGTPRPAATSPYVNVRAFLQWSAKTRLPRRSLCPRPPAAAARPLPERDRTALLGQVLTSQHGAIHPSRCSDPAALRRAGQPIHPRSMSTLINALGMPATAGRAAAIRQHVLGMPAPVVATAFGYHQTACFTGKPPPGSSDRGRNRADPRPGAARCRSST